MSKLTDLSELPPIQTPFSPSPIYPPLPGNSSAPSNIEERNKSTQFQFGKFSSPDRQNILLWKNFARRNFQMCKKLIDV